MRELWGRYFSPLQRAGAVGLSIGMLLAGLGITAVVYLISVDLIQREAHLRFSAETADIQQKISTRVRLYSDVLVTMQALFSASDDISRTEFRDFVNGLNLPDRYPGFQTLNYAAYIPDEDAAEFIAGQRIDPMLRAAHMDFAILPPGRRPAYFVLTYVEPLQANLPSVGLDLGVEPGRLAALARGRDTGEPVSSGRLIFAQSTHPHIGIALRLPVYRRGMPHDTVPERRRAYIGSVGAGIRLNDLMAGLLAANTSAAIRLRIYEAGRLDEPAVLPSSATLLFDSANAGVRGETSVGASAVTVSATNPIEGVNPDAIDHEWSTSVVQPFGGRRWLLVVTADPVALAGTQWMLPRFAALAGVVISLLLAGLAYSLATSRVRAVRLAERITGTLRESEMARAEAQRIAHLGDWRVDTDGAAVHLSTEMARLIGWRGGSAGVDDLLAAIDPHDRAALVVHARKTLRTGEPFELECRYRSVRGRRGWLQLIGRPCGVQERRALRGTALEITPRKLAERARQLEHAISLMLATAASEAVIIQQIVDTLAEGMEWDAAAFWPDTSGQTHALSVALHVREAQAGQWLLSRPAGLRWQSAWEGGQPCWRSGRKALSRLPHAAWLAAGGMTTVFAFGIRAGTTMLGVAEFYARERRPAESNALTMAASVVIQTSHFLQRRQAEDTLRFLATHDVLTGLPNRLMFRERLEEVLARARHDGTAFHVLFIDLDEFKDVNDLLGHNAGDLLLRAVAERLRGQVAAPGDIARQGGDEFVMLVEEPPGTPFDIRCTVDAIHATLERPFAVSGRQLAVTASIGIASYPGDGDDVQTLLKHADIAMYGAKEQGRNTWQLYARQMSTSLQQRIEMESHLRRAVENGELVLYYQPRISLRTNRCTGVEALVRWRHPTLGLVAPMAFIPLAEQTGAIVQIGAWVLREACRQNATWLASGLAPVRVAVNLSARQFADKELHREIMAALSDAQLPGEMLELELTESMVMRHAEQAAAWLSNLKRSGVRLSIDDFGTGYSSLAYLNRFPIDTVKIDRSFIHDIPASRSDAQITSAVIALGHGLGLEVVAEGVETEAHVEFLRKEGCDEVQGYFYSRPIPASEMTLFLKRWQDRDRAEVRPLQSRRA